MRRGLLIKMYLNESKIEFVDIRLLFPESHLVRCNLHCDADNKVPNTYQRSGIELRSNVVVKDNRRPCR